MAKVTMPGSLAVVTGAGSGIGRATAFALAEAGARVIAVDINEVAAKDTAHELGAEHHARTVDVSDAGAMAELATSVEQALGVPDIVVNNAGIGMSGRFLDTTQEDWDAILGVNLRGVINGCAVFGPAMVARRSGHVVNVSSGLGYIPAADTPAYCTTKAAVLHLPRCLRHDWAVHGVGVSAICPGVINTPIAASTRYLGASGEKTKDLALKAFGRSHPPEHVAKAIITSIRRNRSIVPVGTESWGGWYLSRFAPTPLVDLVGRGAARASTWRTRG
ncbi:MAG: SDR family NAD(P)-dependent oxidoreductase [Acidimicrobiales bacterium]|nr:SDR family NAD(P)-dependent oxidoreductase [Acidimicrobiales bacterium]